MVNWLAMLTRGIIMTRIRSFFRHIRDGFRNLFRNQWMTLAAIVTMILTLFMIGNLLLVMSNVENITQDIEEGVKIRVHIDIAASPEDEEVLRQQIQETNHVTEITYRSKEEELEALAASIEEFELVFGDNNPLRNVFVVSVDDAANLQTVSHELSQYPFAVEVTYGELDSENLIKILDYIRIGVALVAAILIVIAIALISNTIKLTIYARSNEVEIMKLVGAEKSYIRAPFAYEGAFIGLIGGMIASILVYLSYEAIQRAQIEWNTMMLLKMTATFPIIYYITAVLILLGILLGVFGARRSIKKFL